MSGWKPPVDPQTRMDAFLKKPDVQPWSAEFGLPPDAPASIDFVDKSPRLESRFLAYAATYLDHLAPTSPRRVFSVQSPHDLPHVVGFPSAVVDALSAMAARRQLDPLRVLVRLARDLERIYMEIALSCYERAILRANAKIAGTAPKRGAPAAEFERVRAYWDSVLREDPGEMITVAERAANQLERKGLAYAAITPQQLARMRPVDDEDTRRLRLSRQGFCAMVRVAFDTYVRDCRACDASCVFHNPVCARLPPTPKICNDLGDLVVLDGRNATVPRCTWSRFTD